jgi:catechol 2,3-dioxygenase-like lactoylglutathione lyase family enzyme
VSAIAKLSNIVLDCTDPAALAAFYRTATGWDVTYSDDDFVCLGDGGPVQLSFQRVAGFAAPDWPDDRKQAHVDLAVADLAAAEKELVAAGASRPGFQPGGENWTVLLDPAGHPFCLSPAG